MSSADINQEPHVLNDKGKPVKINTLSLAGGPAGVNPSELPSRVFFYLYTRATPSSPERLNVGDVGSVSRSHFNPRKPTKFVIHGWQNTYQSKACTSIRDGIIFYMYLNPGTTELDRALYLNQNPWFNPDSVVQGLKFVIYRN